LILGLDRTLLFDFEWLDHPKSDLNELCVPLNELLLYVGFWMDD